MVNTEYRLIIFFAAKDGEALYSQQKQDLELTSAPYCKFRLKLKKLGKITRPFRYDLKQIPHDYTVEVMNRFKGLDLVDRVPEELWMEVRNIVRGGDQNHPPPPKKKKKKRNTRWQSGCVRRPYK